MTLMQDEERQRLRTHLQNEPTERLIEIWQSDDHEEWTEEVLEVVAELLQERLGSLPPRVAPPTEDEESEEADDEADTYHIPEKVVRIATWARWASWLSLALGPAHLMLTLMVEFANLVTTRDGVAVVVVMRALLGSLALGVLGVFCFVLLQIVAEWSYVLLDIEDNTRRTAEAVESERSDPT